jgi:hypothetical protein
MIVVVLFKKPLIKSIWSFPRRRESSQINKLVPRLLGEDNLIRGSFMFCYHGLQLPQSDAVVFLAWI